MNDIESVESSDSGSYLNTIVYYLVPSSASEIVYGVWEPLVSSSFCYGTCVLRWFGLIFGILLFHSVLRVFSVPTAVHNCVNILGAHWVYMFLSPPPSLQESQSTMWQWVILGSSIASLYGMVQWQYWRCRSLLQGASNVETATVRSDKAHQMFRVTFRRINQLDERIQFARFALIVVSAVFWWLYYNNPRITASLFPVST